MDVAKTKQFVRDVFSRLGLTDEHARLSSDVIMQAELTGVITHGLAKLPAYVTRYQKRPGHLPPELKLINRHGINQLFDAGDGSGLIVGPLALAECIKQTKQHGIAAVAVRRSGHFGCGNYYAWQFARHNLIGIIMTNTTPLMAPYGGKEREIGTNPITIVFPAGEEYPIVLDMATSLAAFGKLQIASVAGQKIPTSWAKDRSGQATDDPDEGLAGTLQPLAEHKGYGLAVMVDAFTSLLAGGAFGQNITLFDKLLDGEPEEISHFFLGIDPATFYPLEQFLAHVDAYIRYMKKSPLAEGVEEIFLPGEIEFKRYHATLAHGIELSPEQDARLLELARLIEPGLSGFERLSDWVEARY